jgi:hypothetical protein
MISSDGSKHPALRVKWVSDNCFWSVGRSGAIEHNAQPNCRQFEPPQGWNSTNWKLRFRRTIGQREKCNPV